MIKKKKHIQLLIGFSLILLIWPFDFIQIENVWLSVLYFTFSLTSIYFGLNILVLKIGKNAPWLYNGLALLFSFLFSGLIIWVLSHSSDLRVFLIFISSFILVPTLILFGKLLISYTNPIKDRHSDSISAEEEDTDIIILGENDKEVFNGNPNDILFFESNDNYVIIHFYKNGVYSKEMERMTLKNVEYQIRNIDLMKRVHKSFIINVNNLENILGKSQSYKIKMLNYSEEIPVSRNFNVTDLKAKPFTPKP